MLDRLASAWAVGKAEAMRRLLGIGAFVATELEQEHEIHTVDPKNEDQIVRLVFAGF